MITVCLLMGLPSSGKSSFAEALEKFIKLSPSHTAHVLVVSYDRLIPQKIDFDLAAWKGDFSEQAWVASEDCTARSLPAIWKRHRQAVADMVEAIVALLSARTIGSAAGSAQPDGLLAEVDVRVELCVRQLVSLFGIIPDHEENPVRAFLKFLNERAVVCDCLSNCGSTAASLTGEHHHFLVLDDNMFYRSMRLPFFRLARRYRCSFCQLYFACDKDVAIERNRTRLSGVTDETIIRMSERLEPPDPSMHYWEANSLELSSNSLPSQILETAWSHLLSSSKSPIPAPSELDIDQQERDRLACVTNACHRADLFLRKHLSAKLQAFKAECALPADVKVMADKYNQARKSVLQFMRKSDVASYSCETFSADLWYQEYLLTLFHRYAQ